MAKRPSISLDAFKKPIAVFLVYYKETALVHSI